MSYSYVSSNIPSESREPWQSGSRAPGGTPAGSQRPARTRRLPDAGMDADARFLLSRTARKLRDRGLSVVASNGKIPAHPWCYAKDTREPLGPDDLFGLALQAVGDGRANSLSVRMDGAIAAVDMDFYNPELTKVFLVLWEQMVGPDPVMVTAHKGGKIFIRLQGKTAYDKTIRLCEWDDPLWPGEHKTNGIEIKRDLSAVHGFHSPGVEYRAYGNHRTIFDVSPEDLPEVPITRIRQLFDYAVDILCRMRDDGGDGGDGGPGGGKAQEARLGSGDVETACLCMAAVMRGEITRDQLVEMLGRCGYTELCDFFRYGTREEIEAVQAMKSCQDLAACDQRVFCADCMNFLWRIWLAYERRDVDPDQVSVFQMYLMAQQESGDSDGSIPNNGLQLPSLGEPPADVGQGEDGQDAAVPRVAAGDGGHDPGRGGSSPSEGQSPPDDAGAHARPEAA